MPDTPKQTAPGAQTAHQHGGHTHGHGHDHAHSHECADRHHGHAHHQHGAAISVPRKLDALISARGLSLTRGTRSILEAIDLDIGPGEIVTVIGPNGAGKTTLVRVLLGLERADAGQVKRRDGLKVGYAPQRFDRDPAIPMTVARFLTLAASATPARIAGVLAEVGA